MVEQQTRQQAARERRWADRGWVEQVLSRAEHLPPEDRALVEHVYRFGRPIAEMARLQRIGPRSMQRRLHRLEERLFSTRFTYIAAHETLLPRHLRAVARRSVLQGRSMRDTARLTGLSLHRVRQYRVFLDAFLAGALREPPAGPIERRRRRLGQATPRSGSPLRGFNK